jgi:hypothetical protein
MGDEYLCLVRPLSVVGAGYDSGSDLRDGIVCPSQSDDCVVVAGADPGMKPRYVHAMVR